MSFLAAIEKMIPMTYNYEYMYNTYNLNSYEMQLLFELIKVGSSLSFFREVF